MINIPIFLIMSVWYLFAFGVATGIQKQADNTHKIEHHGTVPQQLPGWEVKTK